MVAVIWTEPAETALADYVDYLHQRDPRIAKMAAHDIRDRVAKLAAHPEIGHRSRWPGLRELSLSRWSKIAVYRIDQDGAPQVLTFYDARQDLTKVNPRG